MIGVDPFSFERQHFPHNYSVLGSIIQNIYKSTCVIILIIYLYKELKTFSLFAFGHTGKIDETYNMVLNSGFLICIHFQTFPGI